MRWLDVLHIYWLGCLLADYIFVSLVRMTDPYYSLMDMDPALTIHNICGKFFMNTTLDLHYLASKIWNSSYNPRRLPALVLRKTKPRATVLIFATGRAMVIGAETMEKMEEVCIKVAREIGAVLNIKKLRAEEVMVTNIVGMGQLSIFSLTQTSRLTSIAFVRTVGRLNWRTCRQSFTVWSSHWRRWWCTGRESWCSGVPRASMTWRRPSWSCGRRCRPMRWL